MRKSHQIAYYQGYCDAISGIPIEILGLSKKARQAYKQGKLDGRIDRQDIMDKKFLSLVVPRYPSELK